MKEIYCGIDFHKKKSWIYAMDENKNVIIDVEIASSKIETFLRTYKNLHIAIEATGGSNHLAANLVEMDFDVKLVETNQFHPRNKKRGKKTDREDAMSLAKYFLLDELPEVYLKSLKSRQLKTLLVQREHLINQRRNITNHIRGILRDYGMTMPLGVDAFLKKAKQLIEKLEEHKSRDLLLFYFEQASLYLEKEREIKEVLEAEARLSNEASRLMTIPGFGPITALCMLAVVDDIFRFKEARKFGAYLGLVPREFSSGGKQRLGPITRSGPEMLRRYLIHGARSVLLRSSSKDPNKSWAEKVKSRSNTNKAVVALAHRNARIAYSILKNESEYDSQYRKQLKMAS